MANTRLHRALWDDKYAAKNTHDDFKPDKDLVRFSSNFPKQGLALDVACGTGRNSFFLAESGLDVVCM